MAPVAARPGAVRPAVRGHLPAVDGDHGSRGGVVTPEGVVAGSHAGVDGRVAGAGAGVAFADEGVGAVRGGAAAGRADLDFLAGQVGGRVQDEGSGAGAHLQHDAAGARRAGNGFGHGLALLSFLGIPRGMRMVRTGPGADRCVIAAVSDRLSSLVRTAWRSRYTARRGRGTG